MCKSPRTQPLRKHELSHQHAVDLMAHLHLPKVYHGTSLQHNTLAISNGHCTQFKTDTDPGHSAVEIYVPLGGLAFVPQGMSTTLSVCKVTWIGAYTSRIGSLSRMPGSVM